MHLYTQKFYNATQVVLNSVQKESVPNSSEENSFTKVLSLALQVHQ